MDVGCRLMVDGWLAVVVFVGFVGFAAVFSVAFCCLGFSILYSAVCSVGSFRSSSFLDAENEQHFQHNSAPLGEKRTGVILKSEMTL